MAPMVGRSAGDGSCTFVRGRRLDDRVPASARASSSCGPGSAAVPTRGIATTPTPSASPRRACRRSTIGAGSSRACPARSWSSIPTRCTTGAPAPTPGSATARSTSIRLGSPTPSGRSAGGPAPLPFVRRARHRQRDPGSGGHRRLRRARLEPLALDALVLRLAEGLLEAQADGHAVRAPLRLDRAALDACPRVSSTCGEPWCDRPSSRPSRGSDGTSSPASSASRTARAPTGTPSCAGSTSRGAGSADGTPLVGAGAGGRLHRPGPLHAHVPLGVRPDARTLRLAPRTRVIAARCRSVTAAPDDSTAALDTRSGPC